MINIIRFREFMDLTEDEIKFILIDMFNPTDIKNIKKNPKYNTITAEMTTSGWNDGSGETFDITDEIELSIPTCDNCGIDVDFSLDNDEITKYKQFLLAKGCDYRLKDNPYLD